MKDVTTSQTPSILYRNHESFFGETLSNFRPEQLFITEDNYCFVNSEYVTILENKAEFYNPYTNKMFSENDIKKLLEVPLINNAKKVLYGQQAYCASRITKETVDQLVLLAEGLLNKEEIFAHVEDSIPISQRAYEVFSLYYNTMQEEERDCLNNYWIGKWRSIHMSAKFFFYRVPEGEFQGHGAVKFKDLYASMNESCVHTVGGCIVKLIMQLEPESKFKFSHPVANITNPAAHIINNCIKKDNSLESLQYKIPKQEILNLKHQFESPKQSQTVKIPLVTPTHRGFGIFKTAAVVGFTSAVICTALNQLSS